MTSTRRHLQYASGYLKLGLLVEAAEELEAIQGKDRLLPSVMSLRSDLYMEAEQWDLLLAVSQELARQRPRYEKGWIHRAYALREMGRVAEAKAVLIEAEPLHWRKSATLHYNLACYCSLLGEHEDARKRLAIACKLDPAFKAAALDDPDLKPMWDDIASMK